MKENGSKRHYKHRTGKAYIKPERKDGYNPYPITHATITMTISALERGETIESIETLTKREPGQLREVIAAMKKTGDYERILKGIRTPGLIRHSIC
jgi:hypothetical protein